MGKGRFLKAAERACATKARFETALDAERTSEWRYRAYLCPVCHGYHLTSRRGAPLTSPAEIPASQTQPGPKLGDLDWTAAREALDPATEPVRSEAAPDPLGPITAAAPIRLTIPQAQESPSARPIRIAHCIDRPGKDHRVRLVAEGRLLKSSPVRDSRLRILLTAGIVVEISDDHVPKILAIAP